MYQPLWECSVLGHGVSIAYIYEGIAPCMFVGLECVDYLVYKFGMPGYICKGLFVRVRAGGE
jgi:hypothetical protein